MAEEPTAAGGMPEAEEPAAAGGMTKAEHMLKAQRILADKVIQLRSEMCALTSRYADLCDQHVNSIEMIRVMNTWPSEKREELESKKKEIAKLRRKEERLMLKAKSSREQVKQHSRKRPIEAIEDDNE